MTVNPQTILQAIIALFGSLVILCTLIISPAEVEDTMLSPDMESFIETSKVPIVVDEWGVE